MNIHPPDVHLGDNVGVNSINPNHIPVNIYVIAKNHVRSHHDVHVSYTTPPSPKLISPSIPRTLPHIAYFY